MEVNMENKEYNEEIDLTQLFKLLKKNLRLIIASMFICAIVTLAFTFFFIDKKYASESTIFITPKINEQTGSIDSNTLTTNSKLVNNYMTILKGDNILSKVGESLKISDISSIKNGISVSNDSGTEVIRVRATTNDPNLSKQIVETTIDVFFTEMKDRLNIQNLTIIDNPKVNETAVSPSKKINTLIGALGGLVLSGGYVLLKYLLDKRLRTREEAENFLGIPVLAEIPFFDED